MELWEERCEALKEGKTHLIRRLLEEIKIEGQNGKQTAPSQLQKMDLTAKETIEQLLEKSKSKLSENGYDLTLCPW